VAKDVASALGYSRPNDAITAHCRYAVKHRIPHPQSVNKTIEVNIIPESDVFRLIMRSNLPTAKKFQD
jgi:anti-repressor protein